MKAVSVKLLCALVMLGMACVVVLVLSGCGGPFPGLRWESGEEQKQSAQITEDLAAVAAYTGLPPRSEAGIRLASGSSITAAYTGAPKSPVDVSPLLPKAVTGAWDALEDREQALKTKDKLRRKASEVVAGKLAEVSEGMAEQAEVAVKELLPRLQAVTDFASMTEEVAKEIRLPQASAMTPEEEAAMAALSDAVHRIEASAASQAARRPTAKEVAQVARETADDWLDMAADVLRDYGLAGVVASVPVVGAVLYGRKRSKQAKAAEVDKAKAEGKAEAAEAAVRATNGNGSA